MFEIYQISSGQDTHRLICSAVPEPAAKRKTLIERTGEVSKTTPATPATPFQKPMHVPVKATPMSTSRNMQSQLVGSRPASALGSYKPTSSIRPTRPPKQASVPASRPASSLESSSTVTERPAIGKRKGMTTISVLDHPNVSVYRPRDMSPTFGMSTLTLSPSCSTVDFDVSLCSTPTPSYIPKPRSLRMPVTPTPVSPCRPVKRSTSPKKIPFLTRDSNIQAWDTKGRLEDIEYLYSELTEKMNGTLKEQKGLEESIDVYQSRSASSFPRRES